MLVIIAVPVAFKYGGDFRRAVVVAEALRVGDVLIISDSTVFGYLLMIGRKQKVGLIAVAEIAAIRV